MPLGVFTYNAAGASIRQQPPSPCSPQGKPQDSDVSRSNPASFHLSQRLAPSLIPGLPAASSEERSALQQRPRHVPIVIPRYVPIVAPASPCNSSLASSPSKSFGTSDLSPVSLTRRPSYPDSVKPRPRHVEIVIPSWAQPVCTLPDTPADTPSDCASFRPTTPPMPPRQTPSTSRANTMDSSTSAPSPSQLYSDPTRSGSSAYLSSLNASETSLGRAAQDDRERDSSQNRVNGGTSAGPSPAIGQTAGLGTPAPPQSSTAGLSGLVCNVHRTTGREPHSLVGATTTILGDKLYVFGGRRLSRTRPQLTADLYELDLIRRHWTKLETKGDVPPPRYFHSVCPLGDTKLVCYGGMSPSVLPDGRQLGQQTQTGESQAEVVVMSDIHIYDVPTRTWKMVHAQDAPQGRYAHCATILPSHGAFGSAAAPLSAIHHNPASTSNSGSLGVSLDGAAGAEMVVVGGQDSANHYIEQISVFNLRNLKWTSTSSLGRACGAYRSVVAPLTTMTPSQIGAGGKKGDPEPEINAEQEHGAAPMLIYSNYNFLDVRLELQIRMPDGSLTEKTMHGDHSPPGLRFPNGGVIDNHFVVSGTFLTSSKQEYALWALDLRTLRWGRIDTGGTIFGTGSWNRGVMWNRRNTFVILGNRKRSLVEDYNNRRINFSNICMIELEAFGLYDNPRRASPSSGYISVSSPMQISSLDQNAGGRKVHSAAEDLGQLALGLREFSDMDFLAIGGERISVNSRLVARRWGPYFNHLLRDGIATQEGTDTATLRHGGRNSTITVTPSVKTAYSNATTLTPTSASTDPASPATSLSTATTLQTPHNTSFDPPDSRQPNPSSRPRTLYLPHTLPTLQALTHYLYTSSLPAPPSPLCTPQILCSLLQLARPYRVDGLLEAVVERLHAALDGRNTAAIFNAAAMAAGGGDGVAFLGAGASGAGSGGSSLAAGLRALRADSTSGALNGTTSAAHRRPSLSSADRDRGDDARSSTSASTSTGASDVGSTSGVGEEREVWQGEMSAVVGLQKRGLRGLMEGRRIREMGRSGSTTDGGPGGGGGGGGGGGAGAGARDERVGLGIA